MASAACLSGCSRLLCLALLSLAGLVPPPCSGQPPHTAQSASTAPPAPRAMGLGTFLVMDGQDVFAAADAGLGATVQRPRKEPQRVLVAEYPWEATMHMYGAVVAAGPADWRLYYACDVSPTGTVPGDRPSAACVATSSDGRAWTKPLMVRFTDRRSHSRCLRRHSWNGLLPVRWCNDAPPPQSRNA